MIPQSISWLIAEDIKMWLVVFPLNHFSLRWSIVIICEWTDVFSIVGLQKPPVWWADLHGGEGLTAYWTLRHANQAHFIARWTISPFYWSQGTRRRSQTMVLAPVWLVHQFHKYPNRQFTIKSNAVGVFYLVNTVPCCCCCCGAIWLGSADEKAEVLGRLCVSKELVSTRQPVSQTPNKQLYIQCYKKLSTSAGQPVTV